MNNDTMKTLEFEKIKTELLSYAVSGLGRRLIEELKPADHRQAVEQRLLETTETRRILDAAGSVPLHGLRDIREILERVGIGAVLEPQALLDISDFLRGCRKLKGFMGRFREISPMLAGYAQGLTDYEELEELIELSIESGRVSSAASQRLAKIRGQMEVVKGRIKDRLNSFLTSSRYREYLQEFIVGLKDGRYCLAVKAGYRNQIEGSVISSSGSGQTLFIEPTGIRDLTNELKMLEAQEEAEEYQVLAGITGEIAHRLASIQLNVETMAAYDFACAKAKYSRAIEGKPAQLLKEAAIVIRRGRHPLIGKQAVPLDFAIGRDYRTLLITGPNTGGKTVALKTIGLMVLMTQAGLHIPAEAGTGMGIFRNVLVDIGDQQSIEQSLSTFSGHVRNLVAILKEAGRGSLVLIDEIGTGTDPAEGAALGAAVLDDLYEAGAVTVASTHYGDLKRFSQNHEGFRNGCMTFDPETLKPLYQLQIGRSGRSNGLWIAERLGMRAETLTKAREWMGRETDEKDEDFESEIMEIPAVGQPEPAAPVIAPGKPDQVESQSLEEARPYRLGDSVFVSTIQENGILCELPDARGDLSVIVKGKRIRVNQKRIKLHLSAEQLYPDLENYDLDIVFLSKENRKLKKAMSKHHIEGKTRTLDGEPTRRL